MSVQAMSAVLGLPPNLVSPTERFVLLIYANHANKEGRNSFPGRETVADETGLSEATVSRATRRLRSMGLLEVVAWPGRDGDGRFVGSVIYNLRIPGLSGAQDATPTRGRNATRTGAQTGAQTGAHSAPVTEEPMNRRQPSFPQSLGELLEATGSIGPKEKRAVK